ncbi:hypothetical protein RRG08_042373 [Elysia crispata]|uniref:Uncharacterized protein n=1 Tax=Elysia crispata TaxID=231223 RepID=A0AAE0ZC58_9GAST|nr:hypothetical protein RRG08_042373 [Elysia crispata]
MIMKEHQGSVMARWLRCHQLGECRGQVSGRFPCLSFSAYSPVSLLSFFCYSLYENYRKLEDVLALLNAQKPKYFQNRKVLFSMLIGQSCLDHCDGTIRAQQITQCNCD